MITSCNCVSGGFGVWFLCLFMPFAKESLVKGWGHWYGWPSAEETYAQIYTNNVLRLRIPKQRSYSGTKFARIFRSDSKLFEFLDVRIPGSPLYSVCISNWIFS